MADPAPVVKQSRRQYLAALMRDFDHEYAESCREFPEYGHMIPVRKMGITGLIAWELAKARLIGFDGERCWKS